ncbi:MAG: phosphopentomutase [Clostridiales bacterium]|nr:phosphopentomutase [Clostridiales bacterium]
MKRVIWIVLDSAGAGYLPDAAQFGDEGANTIGHIAERMDLKIPHMLSMGLGYLPGLHLPETAGNGAYGRAIERSAGKDTTTGHWEMAGVTVKQPFPLYPDGFPQEVMDAFEQAIGRKTLGNKPASGTAILDELGEEHMRTGCPIVYTSGDSVFQIACHEEIVPVDQLYEMCETARALLQGKHGVGRVIARPFIGTGKGAFQRTGRRRDFSLKPVSPSVLDVLMEAGYETLGVGKIEDIFAHQGLTGSNHAAGNPACIDATLEYMKKDFDGLLFTNLVDFDSVYGHRRDVEGYGKALEYFDERLPEIQALMGEDDLLIITADHGCDPAYTGTDHTREYVPLLLWKKGMRGQHPIGTRGTFADTAATVCEYFGLPERFGAESYLKEIEAGCEEEMKRIQRAADAVEQALGRADTAVVLGSGLGDFGSVLADAREIPYRDIPGFPRTTVTGHAGKMIAGMLGEKKVLLMSGRFHSYEGHSMADVTLPIRVMKRLGVKNLILTNAAGGINADFAAGCLMLITDFINLSGKNPLTGANLDAFGPRFPDMSNAYDRALRTITQIRASELGIDLRRGVYCWMNGPTYESPAEVRMAMILGADAVGMSTVPETIVARHCGMKVLGISCITNMAAGLTDKPINHQEVIETGRRVRGDFAALLTAVIQTV